MAALATPQNMLDRFDELTIGGLLSADNKTRVPFADWGTNARFNAAINSATGEVVSRLVRAERYTRTQLESELTDESSAYLVDIVCQITFWKLWKIKPWSDKHDLRRKELKAEYDTMLEMLNNGEIVLELDAAKAAGLPSAADGTTSVSSTRCKYFRSEVARGHLFPSKSSTQIRDC